MAEASAEADVIMILAPDQYQRTIWANDIEPNIKPGAAVAFAHGFNIHYGYIKPSEDHPVFMVAPKGPGHIVRREYAAGRGVPVVVAVERGSAWRRLGSDPAYAKALGALRAGAIKTTFKEETEIDLFGEQNVPGGWREQACRDGLEVLTDAGYQPEIAYFEVCHELKMLVDLMNEGGLNKARWSCSDTAQYGDYVNTVINEDCRKRMEYHLQRIGTAPSPRSSSTIRMPAPRTSRSCRRSTPTSASRPSARSCAPCSLEQGRRQGCRRGQLLHRQDRPRPGSVSPCSSRWRISA